MRLVHYQMPDWQIKLLDREEIADRTIAFFFQKPPGLEFTAGQFVDLMLIKPPEIDAAGSSRTMTIASAPFEDQLMFAMRMRDTAFKRTMQNLPLGSEIMIDDPAGAFTLHRDSARTGVFIAGGIGITPFLSMIRQSVHDSLPHRLYLFFSNRRPEDAAFLAELQTLTVANPRYSLIPTMTQMWLSTAKWEGETGYVNAGMLAKHIGSIAGPAYYVAGPPPMIESMRQMLIEHGVDRNDINADPFDGY